MHKTEYPVNPWNIFSVPLPVGFPLSLTHMAWIVPRTRQGIGGHWWWHSCRSHLLLPWLCLSPRVTHTFLTDTIEQKSPFFIPRCMRSFCAKSLILFYYFDRLQRYKVIPVWFSQLSLYSCCSPASYHQYPPWFHSDFLCETCWNILTEMTLQRSFGRIIPIPFCTTSSSCSFPTLLHCYLPAVPALSESFYHDTI